MKLDLWNSTEFSVYPLAFGAMRFLSGEDNPHEEGRIRHAEALVEKALELGMNLFDHADIYGRGNCETIFGEVLKRHPGWRERMIIQTKCGIIFDPHHRYNNSKESIEIAVDKALGRLGIDQIDVLLVHRPDPLMAPSAIAEAFSGIRQAGKVKYFGVSNFSASQLQLLQTSCDLPLVTNQIQLSLTHPWSLTEGVFINRTEAKFTGAEGLVDYCRLKQLQIQAWSPVGAGILSKKISDIGDPRIVELKRVVDEVSKETGLTPEAISISWLRRHPSKIIPICGTMNADRLEELVKGIEWRMDDDLWWKLFKAALGRPLP